MLPIVLKSLDTVLYQSSALIVGQFAVTPADPRFRDSGPIEYFPVVFPGVPLWIRHRGGTPFLADPTRVVLYNRRQRYTRRSTSDVGDRCHWFSFSPEILAQVATSFVEEPDKDRPYPFAAAPCDAVTFLTHRLVLRHLKTHGQADALWVEETLLALLRRVLEQAYSLRGGKPLPRRRRADPSQLSGKVKLLLAKRFRDPLSLMEIAVEVGSSPFHLSRVFRRQTGSSIHSHRHQLRLCAGLEEVLQTDDDLAEIGLRLGFSSHSHFTGAFGEAFGVAPSVLRRRASRRVLAELGIVTP